MTNGEEHVDDLIEIQQGEYRDACRTPETPNTLTLTTATGATLTIRPWPDGGAEVSIRNGDDECYADMNAASYRAFRTFLNEDQ